MNLLLILFFIIGGVIFAHWGHTVIVIPIMRRFKTGKYDRKWTKAIYVFSWLLVILVLLAMFYFYSNVAPAIRQFLSGK